jgi:hypothetical protein
MPFLPPPQQPTPTRAPSSAPTVSAIGDAHLFGAHGGQSDFKGLNNTWYNFLSTSNLSVAVLFLHDSYNWRSKIVFGSWMKAVAVTAQATTGLLVEAAYNVQTPDVMQLNSIEKKDRTQVMLTKAVVDNDGIFVELTNKRVFSVTNGEWHVSAKCSDLPYHAFNAQKLRLDINLRPIVDVDLNPVAPHGLVGQSYDRDNKMVVGKLDDYDVKDKVVETTAMAEGAIEGTALDYQIDASDPFSTKFKFSRFGLAKAPPRSVSLLSGRIYPASVHSTLSSGAVDDEA